MITVAYIFPFVVLISLIGLAAGLLTQLAKMNMGKFLFICWSFGPLFFSILVWIFMALLGWEQGKWKYDMFALYLFPILFGFVCLVINIRPKGLIVQMMIFTSYVVFYFIVLVGISIPIAITLGASK